MWILAKILAVITRHPRYFPEFQWSDKLWTHNVFRFLGSIFGEYYGIRPNIYSWVHEGKTYEIGYTLEAKLALFEVWVRSLKKEFSYKIVPIPQYALAGVNMRSPFRFAIVLDNYADHGTTNSNTFNKTCTGSNLGLVVAVVGDINTTDNLTGVTYNSIAMLFAVHSRFPADRWYDFYVLANPSTGLNAVTTAGNTFNNLGAISYTGCAATSASFLDSANTVAVGTSSTLITYSTTVVTTGCWLVGFPNGGGSWSNGTCTIRGTTPWIGGVALVDSNAAVGTGVQTMTENQASSPVTWNVISIAPTAAASTALPITSDLIIFN